MRVRYHELVGKQVIAADGKKVGRLADLEVDGRGNALCVTALLVGPAALVRRIGFEYEPLFRLMPPRRIPWDCVARVDRDIHLRIALADLETAATVPLPVPAKEGAAEVPEA